MARRRLLAIAVCLDVMCGVPGKVNDKTNKKALGGAQDRGYGPAGEGVGREGNASSRQSQESATTN